MIDKSELRQLAESAAHKDWYAGNAYDKPFILKYQIITDTPDGKYVLLDGNKNFPEDCVANVAFVGAANPATVLALLDECDRKDAELAQCRNSLQHMIDQTTPLEPIPGDPMWSRRIQLDQVVAERDAALAELEECRKDAERWRFVRSPLGTRSPYAVWQEGRMPVFSAIADACIDAAMSQEVLHD